MKIDLSTVICDLDGKPIKAADAKDFTVGMCACNALLTPDAKDETSGEDKVKRFRLAERVYEGGEQDLSVEDIALLKQLIGKIYPPLTVGRAFEVLDPPAEKRKIKAV